jgi:hypothetical protein
VSEPQRPWIIELALLLAALIGIDLVLQLIKGNTGPLLLGTTITALAAALLAGVGWWLWPPL